MRPVSKPSPKHSLQAFGCSLGLFFSTFTAITLLVQPSIGQEPPAEGEMEGLLEGLDLQPSGEERSDAADSRRAAPSSPADAVSPADAPRNGAPPVSSGSAGGSPLAEAYRSMQTARAMLARGEVGQPAQAAQRRVVDLLDELIRATEAQQRAPQQGTPQGGENGESDSQQTSSDQQSTGDQSDAASQAAAQGDGQPESEEGGDEAGETGAGEATAAGEAGEGGEAAAPIVAAAGAGRTEREAGQGVWGHLPERTRGMLRSGLPTEYLPQYAGQISEYFRALAEMKLDE